jgi:hypothetical protein
MQLSLLSTLIFFDCNSKSRFVVHSLQSSHLGGSQVGGDCHWPSHQALALQHNGLHFTIANLLEIFKIHVKKSYLHLIHETGNFIFEIEKAPTL